MGNIAPTKTKKPPHLRKFEMCLAILFSIWFLTDGIKNIRFPMKYDIIPPAYDMVAKINRKNHGVVDFEAHPMNTSGGINPNKVSETKKNEKIIFGA
jgi:hypothetical protein